MCICVCICLRDYSSGVSVKVTIPNDICFFLPSRVARFSRRLWTLHVTRSTSTLSTVGCMLLERLPVLSSSFDGTVPFCLQSSTLWRPLLPHLMLDCGSGFSQLSSVVNGFTCVHASARLSFPHHACLDLPPSPTGDTDSVMINTRSTVLADVKAIGGKVRVCERVCGHLFVSTCM